MYSMPLERSTMKLKELKVRVDHLILMNGADELEVLVKVEDAVFLPLVPNLDIDDNYYSLKDLCISAVGDK